MKKLARTLALFLSAVMMLGVFSACSSSGNSGSAPAQASGSTAAVSASAAEPGKPDISEEVTLPMSDVPSEPMKLAMTVVATGPIILLYPFLQKYFVKGVTIGAVKG